MRCLPSLFLVVLVLFCASPVSAEAADARFDVSFASTSLEVARLAPVGGAVRLRGVPLSGSVDLDLRRIEVFTSDALLRVQRADGEARLPVPKTVYLSGGIAGSPRSRAFVAVRESGEMRGLVTDAGRIWILEQRADDAAPRAGAIASDAFAAKAAGWSCATDQLDADAVLAELAAAPPRTAAPAIETASGASPDGVTHTARIAFETDTEYLGKFGGNTANAIDYIGDLIAFSSTTYSAEVSTSLMVSMVNLWQTPDPWTQSQGSCSLYEFGRYWNDNNSGISRTLAHFLSGRSSNVGVAWVGVLCNSEFNVDLSLAGCSMNPINDNYGGDYGYTGGIDGNFDIGNPTGVWDIVATAHEIGHNFNSPHTHCYGGLGGNADPVDVCFSGQCGQAPGCHCGATSLPCAQAGAGCGTIMSYCHLLSGGLSNISFTLGLGHAWGVEPERVPARMNSHVVSRAGLNPGCLDLVGGMQIFTDGFESGNTTAWSNTQP